MGAGFEKIAAMTLQDIRETKRYGQTDRRMNQRSHKKILFGGIFYVRKSSQHSIKYPTSAVQTYGINLFYDIISSLNMQMRCIL